jgi:thiamine biosynthesis protein ThiS
VSTTLLMRLIVNGEDCTVPTGQTIQELLETLRLDPSRVAVELDRRIVKPKDWAATPLTDGARLEIVQFVGGG